MRSVGVRALGLALIAMTCTAATAAAAAPEIKVLSNRADLISGGDALVELSPRGSGGVQGVMVDLDGRDVTAAFAERPGGRWMALLDGLKAGANVLTARAPDGSASRLTITNHPIGGPVIDGPQIQPWKCAAGATDPQCNRPVRVEYRYKPSGGGSLQTYDPANPPSDVATTTTDQGKTVPFIVRHEVGALDRDEYRIAVLWDPSKPFTPWAPQEGYNHKLVVNHGFSCDTAYEQAAAPDVLNETALARGFAVMSHALDNAGHNCNILTQAEALIMTKERVVEELGEIRYTIGSGCSGGSLVQQQVANAYPGFYQGLTPACSFTDAWSSAMQYVDYVGLRNYFENPNKWGVGVAWGPDDIAAVEGHPNPVNAITFTEVIPFSGEPTRSCPGVPMEQVYDENTNPKGVRCTLQDYMRNIFGPRDPSVWESVEKKLGYGFAGRPYDNVGIEYGRKALEAGTISPEQFIDLNAKAGGGDIDVTLGPARSVADRPALERVYRSGAVNQGTHLDQVAIIDLRGPDPGAFHDVYRTYVMRARLIREHGHAKNQILWRGQVPLLGDTNYANEAIIAMDRWLAAVEKDKRGVPLPQKIVEDRPADLVERCTNGSGQELPAEACDASVQAYASPRIVAGMPLTDDTIKCDLQPLRRSSYPGFSDAQFAELQKIYPTGVCDYSKPGPDRVPTVPWLSYRSGPGGVPLGDPPRSTSVTPAGCLRGSSRTVAISRKLRGQRVRSVRVNANGKVRLVRRKGRLYAVVDLRKLRGKTMTLRLSRRLADGKLVKTKHSRLVCK
ncbi:MAG TPA: DUF6351 family protein [Thermoleophilaceae bacterium]|jgi:hypothetical protein